LIINDFTSLQKEIGLSKRRTNESLFLFISLNCQGYDFNEFIAVVTDAMPIFANSNSKEWKVSFAPFSPCA
jgi:hypothetical protein